MIYAQDAPRRRLELSQSRDAGADEDGLQSGACHGALAGKGGFKLTLRGYDPEVDYDALTRQSVGRRINLCRTRQTV